MEDTHTDARWTDDQPTQCLSAPIVGGRRIKTNDYFETIHASKFKLVHQ